MVTAPSILPTQTRRRRGVALFFVLTVAVLLLAAGAILGLHLQGRMMIFTDQQRNLHADALLDSGMATVLAELNRDRRAQGSQTVSLDGGEVKVTITAVGVDRRSIEVVSSYRGKTRRGLGLVLLLPKEPPKVISWRPVPVVRAASP